MSVLGGKWGKEARLDLRILDEIFHGRVVFLLDLLIVGEIYVCWLLSLYVLEAIAFKGVDCFGATHVMDSGGTSIVVVRVQVVISRWRSCGAIWAKLVVVDLSLEIMVLVITLELSSEVLGFGHNDGVDFCS